MFFISWGAHDAVAQVGESEIRHCDHCNAETHCSTMVEYRVRHVWWLFRWITDKVPYRLCGTCLRTSHLDESPSPASVKAAIPFWDRRGWTLGAGLVASLLGLGFVANAQDRSEDRIALQSPHPGDIYKMDLARLSTKPEAPVMFGAVRVTQAEKGQVELEFPKVFYDGLRGVDRDIRYGRARRDDYYAVERLHLAAAVLQRMHEDGVLINVER